MYETILGFASSQIFPYQCLQQANLAFFFSSSACCINQRVRKWMSVLCSLLFNQVTHELLFLLAYSGSPCAVLWDWSNLTWFPKGSVAFSLRSICYVSKTLLKWTGTAERPLNELLLCERVTWHIIFVFTLKSAFGSVLDFSVIPHICLAQTHLTVV